MAVGEGGGHEAGVEPGVDHWRPVISEVTSIVVMSTVGFEVRGVSSVVILISGSWLLAKTLPVVVELPPVLWVEMRVKGKVVFLASITTPSSKEPSSSYSMGSTIDDRLVPVTVDRSSAAAGAARRSATARASLSSSRVTFIFWGTLFWEVMLVLRRLRAGPPKRKLMLCNPVVGEFGVAVGFDVWSWAPAARGPRLSSRAQSSMQAAGTMGLGGLGSRGRPRLLPSLPPFRSPRTCQV